jgi:hypothetical protein
VSVDLLDPLAELSDEEVLKLYSDMGLGEQHEPFVLSDLHIITKPDASGRGGGKLLPLIPNESQEMYLDDIADYCPEFEWRDGRFNINGLRLDVLKYRQWGCSTITIGLYLLDTLNNSYVQSRIVAHNPQTTSDLLGIARIMYDNLDERRRPRLTYDNRGELGFSNGSSIRVMLVGSKGAGRGGTVKNFLLSERAFWPSNGNEIEYGLLQSVPSAGNVVRETTANGLDDFYKQYKEDEAGLRDYKALFYGWSPHKEYSRRVPKDFKKDVKEQELQRTYGLTDGQLCFRREKTKEADSLGKKFEQEYPLNAVEAFIGSGKHYYNNDYLLNLANYMRSEEGIEIHKPKYTVALGENGFHSGFSVYKEPERGHYYVGGCDPAGGVTKEGKQNHGSFHLFDLESWEEVLHYHGDPDPWDFGIDTASIASWYNDAVVAVLRINHGHEMLRAMIECSCTGIVQGEDEQWGILENTKTKKQMDDKLGTIINDTARGEPGLTLHSVETVEELITYSHLPGGKAGAAGTAFDDRQSSLKAAVWQLVRDDRRYRLPQKEPPPPLMAYGGRR